MAGRPGVRFRHMTADHESYLGAVGLNYVDWAQRRANVGYWVRTSRIGQGIAPAAISLLKQFAFSALDLECLDVLANPANLASRRVAEKAGAVEKGNIPNPLSPERGQLHGPGMPIRPFGTALHARPSPRPANRGYPMAGSPSMWPVHQLRLAGPCGAARWPVFHRIRGMGVTLS